MGPADFLHQAKLWVKAVWRIAQMNYLLNTSAVPTWLAVPIAFLEPKASIVALFQAPLLAF